jgi:alpha-glucosidase
MMTMLEEARVALPWWCSAVVYQIYPRSFRDTTGNGIGDLEGVRSRLDYLSWLGVDAIWLSPIYPSPMADFGYDVADYCDIHPLFGTLEDFDRLVAEAHQRDIRVLLDWVPNHTSDQHPWFLESRSSRDNSRRDWYLWRDTPNNWVAAWNTGPAWTYDERTEQYYLHLFLPQQPDLNWATPGVVEAMHGVLRFWLDRGVDGFRADVVHLIGKDTDLPDDPPALLGTSRVEFHDLPVTHELLRGVRGVLDAYPGDRMMVGEINLTDPQAIARYHGDGDQLHLAFNFELLRAPWVAERWAAVIDEALGVDAEAEVWPTWVLSNHDQVRHRTRYGSPERARAAAVVLLTLPGTPFLYAGEELGLEDAFVPPDRVVDPGGRDGCRAPIPWDDTPTHGWSSPYPWLPWPPEVETRNAARMRQDEGSILHLYRRLLAVRRGAPALHAGWFTFLEAPPGVLAYERRYDEDERVVLVNFTDQPKIAPLDGSWTVEVSSDGQPSGASYGGAVPPDTALLLCR